MRRMTLHHARSTLACRRLFSNEWFIGSDERGSRAPGGSPPAFKIHTRIVDIAYAFNDRFARTRALR